MPQLCRRIELNRLKIQVQSNLKELFILVQANGKNIHKSYLQKVKNNIVNFFGESVDIEVQDAQLQLKVIQIDQNRKENTLVSFRPKLEEIFPNRKQNIVSKKGNFTLNWGCQPTDLNETDDQQLYCTNRSMSELNDNIYSDEMMQRKIKKCYSVVLNQNQQFDQMRSIYSEIRFTKDS